jgi:hypothetical protein
MGFYLVLAANSLLEILHTYMLGALFSPWYYLPFTGHLAVICFVGMIVRRRQIDLLIGWWFVAVLTIWPFLARFAV